tara:strand:- start:508 stop:705 length:198 start_codon:yes stop_codon:yes gene_type:complete
MVNKRSDENLKERRQLCEDLDYLIREDAAIREELIDEYVYLLNDKRFTELQEYVNKELISDFGRG